MKDIRLHDYDGFSVISDFMVQSLYPLVELNIVGAIEEYQEQTAFKMYQRVDEKMVPTSGTHHIDIVTRPSAKEMACGFDYMKESLLIPMVEALAIEINKLVDDEYLSIELSIPECGLGRTIRFNNIYARIVAGYNPKFCSSELSIDVGLITKSAYEKYKSENENEHV